MLRTAAQSSLLYSLISSYYALLGAPSRKRTGPETPLLTTYVMESALAMLREMLELLFLPRKFFFTLGVCNPDPWTP